MRAEREHTIPALATEMDCCSMASSKAWADQWRAATLAPAILRGARGREGMHGDDLPPRDSRYSRSNRYSRQTARQLRHLVLAGAHLVKLVDAAAALVSHDESCRVSRGGKREHGPYSWEGCGRPLFESDRPLPFKADPARAQRPLPTSAADRYRYGQPRDETVRTRRAHRPPRARSRPRRHP